MSSSEEEVIKITAFDGSTVYGANQEAFFEIGNYLGGGAAGTVYECEHTKTREHYALKILNPIGYKMVTPALLRKCTVVVKGKVLSDASLDSDPAGKEPTREHVWWLVNGSTKQYIGAYYSERHNCLKELSLSQCIQIYGAEPAGVGEDVSGENDATVEIVQQGGAGPRVYVPSVPPKYADFVRRRAIIFREIRNMRKISTHINVIRLEGVLELTQETKCTIFLVMELANGGELFDRIKIDCGTREGTAKFFFQQLLEGVRHCHEQGVCHRDLKPENLLLQDFPESGTTLKIADFGFSARFYDGPLADDKCDNWQQQSQSQARYQQSVVHSGLTPSTPSMLEDSPLRVLKSVVGSPFYVAPEVLQARGYDGPRADVWSLGVILYAMLAGNLPFGQELGTCKRFRHFCKWVRDQMTKSTRFWDDPDLEYPPWLFPAKFSVMAKGLIVSMLHPDPLSRISVQDAISHPLCAPDAATPAAPAAAVATVSGGDMLYKNVVGGAIAAAPLEGQQENMVVGNASLQPAHLAAQPVLHIDQREMEDRLQIEKVMSRGDAMIDEDDEEGGVFRMEEDGDWDQDQAADSSQLKEEDDPRRGPAKAGAPPPHQGSIFGSPPQYGPPLAPLLFNSPSIDDLVLGDDELAFSGSVSGGMAASSSTSSLQESSGAGGAGNTNPPSFSDLVKRSTRFITAVPATEVIEKVERLLEECRFQKTQTPIGYIGKIEVHWDEFRVEVWGLDVSGPPLCALQLYQMPADAASSTPLSPSRLMAMYGEPQPQQQQMAAPTRQLFLVEFIRGQLEIFTHKRLYTWIRQRISELVKREYSYSFLDASPLVDSTLLARLSSSNKD